MGSRQAWPGHEDLHVPSMTIENPESGFTRKQSAEIAAAFEAPFKLLLFDDHAVITIREEAGVAQQHMARMMGVVCAWCRCEVCKASFVAQRR